MQTTETQAKHLLDHMAPPARKTQLGITIADTINGVNAFITAHNALCVKLDADAGVTDTNYTALYGNVPLIGILGSR